MIPWISLVHASPTTISGDALRSMEGTPVLGRGYSVATNSFQSTCLNVEGLHTEPNYNYDCKYKQIVYILHAYISWMDTNCSLLIC